MNHEVNVSSLILFSLERLVTKKKKSQFTDISPLNAALQFCELLIDAFNLYQRHFCPPAEGEGAACSCRCQGKQNTNISTSCNLQTTAKDR